MNLADWVVLFVIFSLFAAAVYNPVRRKKRCGNGCAGCPYAGGCGDKQRN